jgi:hypothetical protein
MQPEQIDAETAVPLSFSRIGFQPQPLLGKENDILKLQIGKVLEGLILNRDIIDPMLLGLVSAAVGSLLQALIGPLRKTMNLNVKITGDCNVC